MLSADVFVHVHVNVPAGDSTSTSAHENTPDLPAWLVATFSTTAHDKPSFDSWADTAYTPTMPTEKVGAIVGRRDGIAVVGRTVGAFVFRVG